ncbi:Uma2 family endonuclease [Kitasatospora sp. NPDC051914]|uniref:Uma2 family endonuclease n=1 Tax=Kitasatospora sp. NPDC051914 TaxID=3154945 RepID=UPI0034372EF2
MSLRGAARRAIVLDTVRQVEDQLAGHGVAVTDAALDLPVAAPGRAPDLVVVPAGTRPDARGRWAWHDLEAVLEVVPAAGPRGGSVERLRRYAGHGVPVYVVVDPAEGVCTVHSDPQPAGAYHLAERVPFGEDVNVQLKGRTLVVATGAFPRDRD